MRWAERIARMGMKRNAYGVVARKHEDAVWKTQAYMRG
jgi:hypothetical protein